MLQPGIGVQAMPGIACGTAIIWGLQVFFALGSAACLLTCLAVPRMQRLMKTRGPSAMPLKRMNLLGLVRVAAALWGALAESGFWLTACSPSLSMS